MRNSTGRGGGETVKVTLFFAAASDFSLSSSFLILVILSAKAYLPSFFISASLSPHSPPPPLSLAQSLYLCIFEFC